MLVSFSFCLVVSLYIRRNWMHSRSSILTNCNLPVNRDVFASLMLTPATLSPNEASRISPGNPISLQCSFKASDTLKHAEYVKITITAADTFPVFRKCQAKASITSRDSGVELFDGVTDFHPDMTAR